MGFQMDEIYWKELIDEKHWIFVKGRIADGTL